MEGEYWVVLARQCEPLAINPDGQRRKLLKLPWAWGKIILAHDASGRKQELFCLNIRSVAGWLFTINTRKIELALRPKLRRYQHECAEVLADLLRVVGCT
jgi:P22_AR N-terminal domain